MTLHHLVSHLAPSSRSTSSLEDLELETFIYPKFLEEWEGHCPENVHPRVQNVVRDATQGDGERLLGIQNVIGRKKSEVKKNGDHEW